MLLLDVSLGATEVNTANRPHIIGQRLSLIRRSRHRLRLWFTLILGRNTSLTLSVLQRSIGACPSILACLSSTSQRADTVTVMAHVVSSAHHSIGYALSTELAQVKRHFLLGLSPLQLLYDMGTLTAVRA